MRLHDIKGQLHRSTATPLTYEIVKAIQEAANTDENPEGRLIKLWDDGNHVYAEWRSTDTDETYLIHCFEYDDALLEAPREYAVRDYASAKAAADRGDGFYWSVWDEHTLNEYGEVE